MTLSIWRFAHLALALISSLFLLILSVTGVILAVDAVQEKYLPYRVKNFEEITLAQSIPALRDAYTEILQVTVDHNDFVAIEALDEEGNNIHAYIDPLTGEKLGNIIPKSPFIQWTTALHRSLFLKETGRLIVGIVSFLLLLITISGILLVIKRQQGILHFFDKIKKDSFAPFYHVLSGRWLLIPVLMIALTGTIIFLVRLDFFKSENIEIPHKISSSEHLTKELKDIAFFRNTKLTDVEKIEFPFIPDDPTEPFIITLKDRIVSINQINGDILHETKLPYAAVLEKINIDLHSGRTNSIWAIILGIASLNILLFIYTGFAITLKRCRTKIRNKYSSQNAEIVILVGSENGSTISFANKIHQQLLAKGHRSFLTMMNQYVSFPKVRNIFILTSTYGLGDAPSNADKFISLLEKYPQQGKVGFSVVGFGSTAYHDYCAFAQTADKIVEQQPWAVRITNLFTVNDKSSKEFVEWVRHLNHKLSLGLSTSPAAYNPHISGLKKFTVVEKTQATETNPTFKVLLKSRQNFISGDLLAIYPADDHRERLYSIGRKGNYIQLVVKLFPNGLGSGFLHSLTKGQTILGRIMPNPSFHFPKNANQVALIANGTGIAPFLGMISDNTSHIPLRLYAGFRHDNELVQEYRQFAAAEIERQHLSEIHFAFSREQDKQYVMDLIRRDAKYFADLLHNEGKIMICGSLQMQKDVEKVLDQISQSYNNESLSTYKSKKQILTDCY